MGVIRELDYNTVVKIAAGEVIDRPASIVRELLDNSIDAGAGVVSVHLSDGGKGYLEVRDNGKGMEKDDLELCTKNHTTSKIQSFDDIFNLNTLGFRGEALSSIAEISQLTISSRVQASLSGNVLEADNGKLLPVRESGMNIGTSVVVKGLFDRIPARKKFLSSAASEIKFIDKEITKKALAHPGISFELVVEGKRKYISPARSSLLEKIADFFPDAIDYLIPVEHIAGEIRVMGFVSKPAFIRPTRLYQMLFVNSRAVEWKNFYFALTNAYGNLIPRGQFPAAFVYIEVEPHSLDVNVHPMKREVRFADERKVSKALEEAVHAAITADVGFHEGEDTRTEFSPFEKKVGQALRDYYSRHSKPAEQGDYRYGKSSNVAEDSIFKTAEIDQPQTGKREALSSCRYAGSVFHTYLILEGGDTLYFLDQHAAHERINYEKLKLKYQSKILSAQELLVPVTIDVPPQIADELRENITLLASMGFDVEYFGGSSFIIRSAPEYIDYAAVGDVVMGFVETLEERQGAHTSEFVDSALKQMACKSSIRSGDDISREEALALVREWENTSNRDSCPHGRPVVLTFGKNDLEKAFKRLGF